MNLEAYISSGIIEAYVLGTASEIEQAELLANAAMYPKIKMAIDEARILLEDYAVSHSVPPPIAQKERIWQALQENTDPVVNHPTPIVQSLTPKSRRINFWLLAASVLILLGSLILNIDLWQQNQANKTTVTVIQKKQLETEQLLAGYQQYIAMLVDTSIRRIQMDGVGTHTDTRALVLWNVQSKEVYIAANNLPAAPPDKQYQLWAIVDGKPIDAGVFEPGKSFQKMKGIDNPNMFAVTLEKAGGSATPTLDQMYVAGKI